MRFVLAMIFVPMFGFLAQAADIFWEGRQLLAIMALPLMHQLLTAVVRRRSNRAFHRPQFASDV